MCTDKNTARNLPEVMQQTTSESDVLSMRGTCSPAGTLAEKPEIELAEKKTFWAYLLVVFDSATAALTHVLHRRQQQDASVEAC